MNDRIEQVKSEAAETLARVEIEEAFRPSLPEEERENALIYKHRHHMSVRLGDSFRSTRTFKDACALLLTFGEPVTCQHRAYGCLSTWPDAAYGPKERDGELKHESQVRIDTNRIVGTVYCEVSAWFTIGVHLVEVSIPFAGHTGPAGLLPTFSYNRFGVELSDSALWRGIGEDFYHKWWAEAPDYRRSRHWETMEGFKEWLKRREENEQH